jgi:hypothetical protein
VAGARITEVGIPGVLDIYSRSKLFIESTFALFLFHSVVFLACHFFILVVVTLFGLTVAQEPLQERALDGDGGCGIATISCDASCLILTICRREAHHCAVVCTHSCLLAQRTCNSEGQIINVKDFVKVIRTTRRSLKPRGAKDSTSKGNDCYTILT